MEIMKFYLRIIVLFFIFNFTTIRSQLRIGYISSWDVRCGIAMYTKHICESLKKLNYPVFVYGHKMSMNDVIEQIKKDKINILNIQEPAYFVKHSQFISKIREAKDLGIKIVATIHNEGGGLYHKDFFVEIEKIIDQFIIHKPHKVLKLAKEKENFIPMGVPVFNSLLNKNQVRKKYGFKENDLIISTNGTMWPWKEYPGILNVMIPYIKKNPNIKVQLLTSFSDFCGESPEENRKIKKIIEDNNLKHQVIHITDFLPQQELSERLWISDIGYLWGDIDVGGTSASSKEFITSRLPCVITNSEHFHDTEKGFIKVERNRQNFVNTIFETLKKKKLLNALRHDIEIQYNKLNYGNIIKDHLKLFNKISN